LSHEHVFANRITQLDHGTPGQQDATKTCGLKFLKTDPSLVQIGGPALTDIKRPSSNSLKQPATGLDALGGQPPA